MNTNITSVSQAAGDTGSAPGQVLSSAKVLTTESDKLGTAVEGFMEKVKAAYAALAPTNQTAVLYKRAAVFY